MNLVSGLMRRAGCAGDSAAAAMRSRFGRGASSSGDRGAGRLRVTDLDDECMREEQRRLLEHFGVWQSCREARCARKKSAVVRVRSRRQRRSFQMECVCASGVPSYCCRSSSPSLVLERVHVQRGVVAAVENLAHALFGWTPLEDDSRCHTGPFERARPAKEHERLVGAVCYLCSSHLRAGEAVAIAQVHLQSCVLRGLVTHAPEATPDQARLTSAACCTSCTRASRVSSSPPRMLLEHNSTTAGGATKKARPSDTVGWSRLFSEALDAPVCSGQ
jgi:hypothetical protein